MRFVATSAIAIASLIGPAIECWGQAPAAQYGGPAAIASDLPAARGGVPGRLAPPGSAGGTWISDKDQGAAAMNASPAMSPLPAAQPTHWAEAMASPGGPQGPCAQGSCDCADGPCNGQGPCGPVRTKPGCFAYNDLWTDLQSHRRIYVQTDYVSWWVKGNALPPLVTASSPGVAQSQAGVLPETANTTILFGNDRVDTQTRNGARINVGYWLIDGEFLGIEGQYFALQHTNTTFRAVPTALRPTLAEPFINVDPLLPTPKEDANLLAFDGLFDGFQTLSGGKVDVRTTSNVQGGDALFRKLIWVDFTSGRRLDLLAGYRFFRFDDSVTIDAQVTATPGDLFSPPPLTSTYHDVFSARNEFHGGDFGLKFQQYWGRVSAELVGKIAVGVNSELAYINGSTNLTGTGVNSTFVGGFFTQPTNIGTYRRDVVAVLPEANANIRIDITRNARLVLGYNFIYLNRVQRSGDAIDRAINPTQRFGGPITEPLQPAFAFSNTTLWMHGANFGFEYRW